MDRGAAVGLGDDEQLALARHPAGLLAQSHALARRVIAQQPEARALQRGEHVGPRVVAQLVLAVAEEGEVVVGQPGEQPTGLLDLLGGDADGRGLVEDLRDLGALGTHLGPVLNDLAHVGEHAAQVGRDLLAVEGVAVAVDLEVHPGLAQDPELGSRAAPVDAAESVAPRSRISSSSPVASRRTSISGCTTMWTVRPMRVSSAVTESTRKGMSSVTIWTTVCPLAQPCSSNSGLNTSTLAVPTGGSARAAGGSGRPRGGPRRRG